MLSFGVTIPATVSQRSEIPERLTNYPVLIHDGKQEIAVLTMRVMELCTVQFLYLQSCGVRKWRKTKEKGEAGYAVPPVLWHETSVKNTSPSYIGR
jgi:hypothetical protein